MDRLRGFLADKIEQSNDTAVTAVAQKVYAYLLVMETQLVDMESDASPEAISIQRMTLMPLVLRGIGAMRRYAKKSAARKPLEVALLTKDFLLPWVLALAAAANDSEGASSGSEWGTGGSDHEAASRKRPRDVPSALAVSGAQAQLRGTSPFEATPRILIVHLLVDRNDVLQPRLRQRNTIGEGSDQFAARLELAGEP